MEQIIKQVDIANDVAKGRWHLLVTSNPLIYTAVLLPSTESPYQGGIFSLQLKFTEQYPMIPPRIRMLTKIFHPNFSEQGELCSEKLYTDYIITFTIDKIMEYIWNLFITPDLDSLAQCNYAAIDAYRNNTPEFNRIASDWTRKFT